MLFWSTERRIATPNSNGSYIWNNFQDQTSTAKVTPPPKYTYEMPHHELQHTFGNFFSSRWWKFWHVLLDLKDPIVQFKHMTFTNVCSRINFSDTKSIVRYMSLRKCITTLKICMNVSLLLHSTYLFSLFKCCRRHRYWLFHYIKWN